MTDRELMQQALEALERYGGVDQRACDAEEALRERLAQPEQEPVAWRFRSGTWFNREVHWRYIDTLDGAEGLRGLQPLYTEPQKQWVGLNHFDRTLLRTTYAPLKRLHHIKETNTDIVAEIVNDWDAFFTAIEAKLNTETSPASSNAPTLKEKSNG